MKCLYSRGGDEGKGCSWIQGSKNQWNQKHTPERWSLGGSTGSLVFKVQPKHNSIGISWEVVRNAEPQSPSQTCWIRIYSLTRSPGDLFAHRNLRNTSLVQLLSFTSKTMKALREAVTCPRPRWGSAVGLEQNTRISEGETFATAPQSFSEAVAGAGCWKWHPRISGFVLSLMPSQALSLATSNWQYCWPWCAWLTSLNASFRSAP